MIENYKIFFNPPEILNIGELFKASETDELSLPVVLQLVLGQALPGLGALLPGDLHLDLSLLLLARVALLGVTKTLGLGLEVCDEERLERFGFLHGKFSLPLVKPVLPVPPGLLEELEQILLERPRLVMVSHQV